MHVTCPQCHQPLPSSAINLDRLLAKCDPCKRLFDCSAQLPPARPNLPAKRQRLRPPVPLPAGMQLEVTAASEQPLADNYRSESPLVRGSVKIERRWRASAQGVTFRIVFSLLWFGFLAGWYVILLNSGVVNLLTIVMLVLPLAHIAAGLYIVHSVLADLFNTSTISADPHTLTIHHGPVPVPGNKQIPVAAIEQLYSKQIERTHKGDHHNNTSVSYAVLAVLTGGRELVLIDKLPTPEQALFIEQRLEAHLGIIDGPVDDELPALAGR